MFLSTFALALLVGAPLEVRVMQRNLPATEEPLTSIELSVEVTNHQTVPVEVRSIDLGAPLRLLSGNSDGSGSYVMQRQSITEPRVVAPGKTETFHVVREVSASRSTWPYANLRVEIMTSAGFVSTVKMVKLRAEKPIEVRLHYRR